MLNLLNKFGARNAANCEQISNTPAPRSGAVSGVAQGNLYALCVLIAMWGLLVGCIDPIGRPDSSQAEKIENALEYLQVEQVDVERDASGISFLVRFSQEVTATDLENFASIDRIIGHLIDGDNPHQELELTAEGEGRDWRLFSEWGADDGAGYRLRIRDPLQSVQGRRLDGTAGPVSGTAGRNEEDYFFAPSAFVSKTSYGSDLQARYVVRDDLDRVVLSKLEIYDDSNSSFYGNLRRTPFQVVVDRSSITPALESAKRLFRLEFGHSNPWLSLVSPVTLKNELRFVDETGAAFESVLSYNADPGDEIFVGAEYAITSTARIGETDFLFLEEGFGNTLLGPELNTNPGDVVRVYIGNQVPGIAPMPIVKSYNGNQKRIELDWDIAASAFEFVEQDQIRIENSTLPPGYFVGTMYVEFSDGTTRTVLGHDGVDFVLETGPSLSASLATAPVELKFFPLAAHNVQTEDTVFFVASHVYASGAESLVAGARYELRLGIETPLRNLHGVEFTDRLRDGDEKGRQVRDDSFFVNFAISAQEAFPVPLHMVINDGTYYPMIFDTASLQCASITQGICIVDQGCGTEFWMSFATPDGTESTPKGRQDLLSIQSDSEPPFRVYKSDEDGTFESEVPIQWGSRTVLATASPDDDFQGGPTTLLFGKTQSCQPLGFGDVLVIRHTLKPAIEANEFLDGNGDGLLTNDSEEDFIRWFAGSQTGFVRLAELELLDEMQ